MITPVQIENLREKVASVLSEKRMKHVLAVEDMAFRLGLLYFFQDDEALILLRAAALLHDVTKELSDEEQLAILESYSVKPLPEELASMPTIHALTAALVIPERFPKFADQRVIDAVRYHTTGREGMSVFEKIIFLGILCCNITLCHKQYLGIVHCCRRGKGLQRHWTNYLNIKLYGRKADKSAKGYKR